MVNKKIQLNRTKIQLILPNLQIYLHIFDLIKGYCYNKVKI
mgnify:CR=1 FL=1